jgi:hypothetical protein
MQEDLREKKDGRGSWLGTKQRHTIRTKNSWRFPLVHLFEEGEESGQSKANRRKEKNKAGTSHTG